MSSTPSYSASKDPSPASDSSAISSPHGMHSPDVNVAHLLAPSVQPESSKMKLMDALPETVGSSLSTLSSLPDDVLPSSLSAYSNLSNGQLHQFLLKELDSLAAAAMPYRYGSMVNNAQIPLVPACLCCPAPLTSSPSVQPFVSSTHHSLPQTQQGTMPSQPTVLHTLFQSQAIQRHATAYKKNYDTPSLTNTATMLTNASSSSTSSRMDTLSILPHPLLSLSLHEDPLLNGDLPSSSLRARILLLLEREREVVRRERLVCLAERALMDDAVAMRKRALAVAVCARETQRQMANLAVLGAGEEVVMNNNASNRQIDGQLGAEGYVEAREGRYGEERIDTRHNEQIGENTEFGENMVGKEASTAASLDSVTNTTDFNHSKKTLHIDTAGITSTDDDDDEEDEDEEDEDENDSDDDVSGPLHTPPLPQSPTLDFAVVPDPPAVTSNTSATTTAASPANTTTTTADTDHHVSCSSSPSPSSDTATNSLPLLALIEAAAADDVIEADTWLRNLCSDATQLHTSLKTIEKTYAHARVLELVGALRWAICELYRRDKRAFIGSDMNVVVPNLDLLLSTTPIMEVSLAPLVDILTQAGTAPIPTSLQLPVPAMYTVNQAAESPLPYFPPPPLPLPLPLSGLSVSCAFTSYSAYLHAIYEHCTTTTSTITSAMTTAPATGAADVSGVVISATEGKEDKGGDSTSNLTSFPSHVSTSTSTSTSTSSSTSSPSSSSSAPPRPASPASIKAMLSTLGSLLAAHCREEQQRAKDWVRLVGEEVEREDMCVSGEFGDGAYVGGAAASATTAIATPDAVSAAATDVDNNSNAMPTSITSATAGADADGGSRGAGVEVVEGSGDIHNVDVAIADTKHTHTATHAKPAITTTSTHPTTSDTAPSSPPCSLPPTSSSILPLPPHLPALLTLLSQHLAPLLKLLTLVGEEGHSHSVPVRGNDQTAKKKGNTKTMVGENAEEKDEKKASETVLDGTYKHVTVISEKRGRTGETEDDVGNANDDGGHSYGDERSNDGSAGGRGVGICSTRDRDEDSEKARGNDTDHTAPSPLHSPLILAHPQPPLTPRLHTPRTPRQMPSRSSLPPLHGDLPPPHNELMAIHSDRNSLYNDSSVSHSDRNSLHNEASLSALKSSRIRPSPSPSPSPSPMRKRGPGTGTGPSTTATPGRNPSRLPMPRRRVVMGGNADDNTKAHTTSPMLSPKGVNASTQLSVSVKDGNAGRDGEGYGGERKGGKSYRDDDSEFGNKSIISHVPGLNIEKSSESTFDHDIPKSNSHNSFLSLASSSSSSLSPLLSHKSLNALKNQSQEFTSSLGNLLPSAPFPDALSQALLHLASQVEQHIAVCRHNSNMSHTGMNNTLRQNNADNAHVEAVDGVSSHTDTKRDVHADVNANARTKTDAPFCVDTGTGASNVGGSGGSTDAAGVAGNGPGAGAGAGGMGDVSMHHEANFHTHTTTHVATTLSRSSYASPTNAHTNTSVSTSTSTSALPHARTPTLRADPTTIARFAWSAPAPLLALLLKKGVPLGFTPTIASTSTPTSASVSSSQSSAGVDISVFNGTAAASNDIARFSSQQAISQGLQPLDPLLYPNMNANMNTNVITNTPITAISSPPSALTNTTVSTGVDGVSGANTGTGVNVTDSPSLRAHRPTLPSIFESPSPTPLHTMVRHTTLPKIQDTSRENSVIMTSSPASSSRPTHSGSMTAARMGAGIDAGKSTPTLPISTSNVPLPLPGISPGISGSASGLGHGVLSLNNLPHNSSNLRGGDGNVDDGMGGDRDSAPVLGAVRTPRGISADNTPRNPQAPSHTPSYGSLHPSSHYAPHTHPPRTLSPSKRMSFLASPSEFDLNKPVLSGNGSSSADIQLQQRPSLNIGTVSVDKGTGYANTGNSNSRHDIDLLHRAPTVSRDISENGGRGPGKIRISEHTPNSRRGGGKNGTESMSARGRGSFFGGNNSNLGNGTESISGRPRGSIFSGNGLESSRGDGTSKRASVMDRVPTNVNDTKDAFQFTSGGHWQLNADRKGG